MKILIDDSSWKERKRERSDQEFFGLIKMKAAKKEEESRIIIFLEVTRIKHHFLL